MTESCDAPIVVVGRTFYCRLELGHQPPDHPRHRAPVTREMSVEEFVLERGAEITWPVDPVTVPLVADRWVEGLDAAHDEIAFERGG